MKNIPKGGTMGESLTLGQLLIPKPTRMYVSDRLHLLAEYMRDKNPLPPEQVTAGSGKKVWWKCSKCNHPWQAAPNDRKHGKGCPACAGKRIRPDKNTGHKR